MNELQDEVDVALEAVRQAAAVCRRVQAGISGEVLEKRDRSPVTVADYASQALICRRLGERWPAVAIIAEEEASALRADENAELAGRVVSELAEAGLENATLDAVCQWLEQGKTQQYSDRFWTLDPIDGTKGFLRGEQYAISLALIVEGRIELGVLGCPNLPQRSSGSGIGCLFLARRGAGAIELPLAEGDVAPGVVSTTDTRAWDQARFCESVESGHSSHGDSAAVARTLGIQAEPVRLDSQAKYAVVARGEADAYMRLPTRPGYREKIWDHAAGVLLVEEAGGLVTDVDGRPLDFCQGAALEQNRGILAANRHLHAGLVAAVSGVLSGTG